MYSFEDKKNLLLGTSSHLNKVQIKYVVATSDYTSPIPDNSWLARFLIRCRISGIETTLGNSARRWVGFETLIWITIKLYISDLGLTAHHDHIFLHPRHHRWQGSPSRTFGLHRLQTGSFWAKNCSGEMRGNQHLWQLLPEQGAFSVHADIVTELGHGISAAIP